jgi:hypothetical protein
MGVELESLPAHRMGFSEMGLIDVAVSSSRNIHKYLKILDVDFWQHYVKKQRGIKGKTP